MAKIILKDGTISSSAGIDISIAGNKVLNINSSSLDLELSYLTLSELVQQPVMPAPSKGAIYISSSDSRLYFKNDLGDTYNLTTGGGSSGDIEGVLAGTNLTGGGSSGTVTLNLATNLSALSSIESFDITSSGTISGSTAIFSNTTTKLNGFKTSVSTKSSNSTILNTEHVILGNAAAGQITLTLPSMSLAANQQYIIKKIDSTTNKVILSGSGNETIDGLSGYSINTQYQSISVVTDGTTGWYLV